MLIIFETLRGPEKGVPICAPNPAPARGGVRTCGLSSWTAGRVEICQAKLKRRGQAVAGDLNLEKTKLEKGLFKVDR